MAAFGGWCPVKQLGLPPHSDAAGDARLPLKLNERTGLPNPALIGCDECLLHAKVCERMMSLLKPSRIGPCRLARLNFMHEFDELFVLEIAKRAAQQIMLMPDLASLRWSSPVVKSFSDVGALVTFGEMWNASAKLVTANWIVDGSEGWLDFLLWLSPGERPEMEVINFRERWNTVPLDLVATNAQVADHPAWSFKRAGVGS